MKIIKTFSQSITKMPQIKQFRTKAELGQFDFQFPASSIKYNI